MPENWRDFGDVPADFWRSTISGHGGPATFAAACYDGTRLR